jgi:alkylated DNA repair protein (DNA oxidative demethylase)
MLDLFADAEPWQEPLAPGAVILRRFAPPARRRCLPVLKRCGGFAVSPYGDAGRLYHVGGDDQLRRTGLDDERAGYLYAPTIPHRPAVAPMPAIFQALCHEAAVAAAIRFSPDACLINRYAVGAKLSLHQDKDEPDLRAPIVSVSLGCLPSFSLADCAATTRSSAAAGAWRCGGLGGIAAFYHGIQPLKPAFIRKRASVV